MRKKTGIWLFCVWLLCASFPVSVYAGNDVSATAQAQNVVEAVFRQKLQETDSADIQSWIDTFFTENVGAVEWYVLAVSQYGTYDFSSYETALLSYLHTTNVSSASSRLKYALVLHAIGSCDSYITNALADSVGEQGIMSWIFGLHLLNNGYSSEKYTQENVVQTILALQTDDGGWSVTGDNGDVDVTAMALQALAPCSEMDESVRQAIDRALSFLSEKQLANGGYASYGAENPESAAQVLIALSALQVDGENDDRFIQNGYTVFDGIFRFQTDSGCFSHQLSGEENETATVQAMCAMIAYTRMAQGQTSLYLWSTPDSVDAAGTTESEKTPESEKTTDFTSDSVSNGTSEAEPEENPEIRENRRWKWYGSIGICLLGGGVCIVCVILGKKNYKNYTVIALAVCVGLGVVWMTDIQSADAYYQGTEKREGIGTVTLSIRCDTVVGKSEAAQIPADGVILPATEFVIEDGESVFALLTEAARQYTIIVESRGNGQMVYVSGIQSIYELEFGDLSGWMYYVNGAAPSVGCGAYVLSDGDTVEWLYSCELGNDLS